MWLMSHRLYYEHVNVEPPPFSCTLGPPPSDGGPSPHRNDPSRLPLQTLQDGRAPFLPGSSISLVSPERRPGSAAATARGAWRLVNIAERPWSQVFALPLLHGPVAAPHGQHLVDAPLCRSAGSCLLVRPLMLLPVSREALHAAVGAMGTVRRSTRKWHRKRAGAPQRVQGLVCCCMAAGDA